MSSFQVQAWFPSAGREQELALKTVGCVCPETHLLGTQGGQPRRRHGGHGRHADLSCHLVHVVHAACVGRHGYTDVHIVIVNAGVCLLPKMWWGLL